MPLIWHYVALMGYKIAINRFNILNNEAIKRPLTQSLIEKSRRFVLLEEKDSQPMHPRWVILPALLPNTLFRQIFS